MCLWQVVQTVSATDADEPSSGHKFFFSLAPEAMYRSNFSVRDNGGERLHPSYLFLKTAAKNCRFDEWNLKNSFMTWIVIFKTQISLVLFGFWFVAFSWI